MSILAEYLAVLLLDRAISDEDTEEFGGSIPAICSGFNDQFGIDLNDSDVVTALNILEIFGAAEMDYSPLTDGFWVIKYDNFRYYFRQISPDDGDDPDEFERIKSIAEKFKILSAYARRGEKYAKEALRALQNKTANELADLRKMEADAPRVASIPASNRIVTINHNSKEFEEMVGTAKKADESIRSSNSIDEDGRNWIRDHIKLGLELIKNKKVLTTAVSALLLQPLLNAYEAVTEEPAKQAIWAAIKAVRTYFGIL